MNLNFGFAWEINLFHLSIPYYLNLFLDFYFTINSMELFDTFYYIIQNFFAFSIIFYYSYYP